MTERRPLVRIGGRTKQLPSGDTVPREAVAANATDVAAVLRAMRDGATVKVVCVGDSITYGQLDTGGAATTPYPARLQALLRKYYDNANITVVNKGISGSKASDVLARFATDITAEDPDLVVFNVGANDSREANSVTLEAYASNVETYLNQLRPTPTIVMGVTPRFKEQRSGEGEGVIHFYRQALRRIAEARAMPYVDTFARLHALYKSRALAAGFVSSDGSHYSEQGYQYIGDVVFADGFANDDLRIRPGQHKDLRGQWLLTEAADSSWGASLDNQDAYSIVLAASASVSTLLFVEDWTECVLVMHCVIDGTNSAGQAVTVTNNSLPGPPSATLALSPLNAAGTAWFAQDYAIPAVRLRPGINDISLAASAAGARLTGVSVLPLADRGGYLASYNPDSNGNQAYGYWGSTRYDASPQSATTLRDGLLVVSNNATGFIQHYFDLVPETADQTTRWRWRATVRQGATFYLGQQSTSDVDYMPVYTVLLDGTNVTVSARDHAGVSRTVATVALAFATEFDIKVDLASSGSGWSLWINDALIYSDTVPLSAGPVYASAAAATGRCYLNPPIRKGRGATDTGVVIGETWTTFSGAAPTQKLVDAAATTRTLTYT